MDAKTALIIVDVQNDFLPPDGALAVPDGRDVVPVIQRLLGDGWKWDVVIATQDYHPRGHISFASTHGANVFDTRDLEDARGDTTTQTLWPDHCVIGTPGAEIEKDLRHSLDPWKSSSKIVRKGWHTGIEAYSSFEGYVTDPTSPLDDPDSTGPVPLKNPSRETELAKYLREEGVERVVVVGLATDYCVRSTTLSALEAGFETLVYEPAIKGIQGEGSQKALQMLASKGAKLVKSEDDLKQLV